MKRILRNSAKPEFRNFPIRKEAEKMGKVILIVLGCAAAIVRELAEQD